MARLRCVGFRVAKSVFPTSLMPFAKAICVCIYIYMHTHIHVYIDTHPTSLMTFAKAICVCIYIHIYIYICIYRYAPYLLDVFCEDDSFWSTYTLFFFLIHIHKYTTRIRCMWIKKKIFFWRVCICVCGSIRCMWIQKKNWSTHTSFFFLIHIHRSTPFTPATKKFGHPTRMKKNTLEKVKRYEPKTPNFLLRKMGNREIAVEWKLGVWASRAWWRWIKWELLCDTGGHDSMHRITRATTGFGGATGWLRLVGYLKLYVSFAEYCLFCKKRLIPFKEPTNRSHPIQHATARCGSIWILS